MRLSRCQSCKHCKSCLFALVSSRFGLLHNSDAHLSAVRPNLGNVHRVTQHGQRMKHTRNLGSHFIANLPDAFGEMIDEQGNFAIAQFPGKPTAGDQ